MTPWDYTMLGTTARYPSAALPIVPAADHHTQAIATLRRTVYRAVQRATPCLFKPMQWRLPVLGVSAYCSWSGEVSSLSSERIT